ncbi:MAG: thioredoxin family protein [Thermoleophilaceae bacterium]|nr:thioredoxin family protein [Thermoleophilaceae bacterium]
MGRLFFARGTPKRALIMLGLAILCLASTLAAAGCGDSEKAKPIFEDKQLVEAADVVNLKDFPKTDGKKNLIAIVSEVGADTDLSMAPGATEMIQGERNRLPFGLFSAESKPIWAPTVIYLAKDDKSPATGPFAAPGAAIVVPKDFRSETSKSDYGKLGNGIYIADFKAPKANQTKILTVSNINGKYHTSNQPISLLKEPTTPKIGDKAPNIETPTVQSAGGPSKIKTIETRVPPDSMHEISLKTALAQKKPVVISFSTPLLCVSRVCGPVTDIAEYLNSRYSDQVVFIHNEIYNNNKVEDGFRSQVGAFGLPTEPYTFVIDRNGRIAAKFEGPLTVPELEAAVIKVSK